MIEIYGSPKSSAGRVYFMVEELGLKYTTMPMDMRNRDHKSPEFLKLNPNGKVPCLKENDFVIWESLAINNYLAEKHKPEMLGSTPEEKGLVSQWSIWAMTELQPPLVDILIQMVFVPADKRNHSVIEKAQGVLPERFQILDKAIGENNFLVGDKLTVADINLSTVVDIANTLEMDMTAYKNIKRWMDGITARPAWRKFH